MTANGTTVNYKNTSVVQACNIIGPDDIHKAGYAVAPSPSLGSVQRQYFDGQGQAQILTGRYSLPEPGSEYVNECSYDLSHAINVTVAVYQPSYVAGGSFDRYLASKSATSQPSIDGVSVSSFRNPDTGDIDYALTQNGVGVIFFADPTQRNTNPKDVTEASQRLLRVSTQNLRAQLAQTTGPSAITYGAFGKYADGCSLVTNADFYTIFGVDASPIAIESAVGGVGTTKFAGDSTSYNYVDNECMRESYVDPDALILSPIPGAAVPDTQHLIVRTETFQETAAAQKAYAGIESQAKEASDATGIGDEAFFASSSDLENPLILREGRYIVEISPTQLGIPSNQSQQQIMQELTPLGQKIASELR